MMDMFRNLKGCHMQERLRFFMAEGRKMKKKKKSQPMEVCQRDTGSN